MIRFSSVTKRYPNGHEALQGIDCEFGDGELVVVTGRSGAGKSTLLKLAAGIERATSGSVVIRGQNLSTLREGALAALRRHVGFVFQDHKLLFDRSVADNVALPLRITGTPAQEERRRVRAALDKVGLLAREKSLPITLSGGEQQLVCIARAIVHRPGLLIADEPTGNLDAETARSVLDAFLSFHQVGVTVLLSAHDAGALAAAGGRRLALAGGRLCPEPAA